ncbi:PREDICTED: uncharacterized protein LOC109480339 [Branchiostoma belcheri]|uniref:Uncharacterized protein LOC109480339 n=1 Tax=Branchiostoma belcheri TaxID=7741 RepID=A0A6P5A8M2_BRABE|nr:PREDICTED: uncharacterized protein LOC109480339 [Branchiostoma belcheri]
MAEEGKDSPKDPVLAFEKVEARLLKCHYGYLIEKTKRWGGNPTGRLTWAPLTEKNKSKALLWVYTFKTTSPEDGTFVVLEFVRSGKFIIGPEYPDAKVILKKGGFTPKSPVHIKKDTDPRLLMMRGSIGGGTADVVFEAYESDDTKYVVTLYNNRNKAARVLPEGGANSDGQTVQLHDPELQHTDDDNDFLEVVP